MCCLKGFPFLGKHVSLSKNYLYISNKKLPKYPAHKEEVLLPEELVGKAKRLAQKAKLPVSHLVVVLNFVTPM